MTELNTTTKTSEAQLRASKKWQEKNKEQSNYTKAKSACKSFIRTKATKDVLKEIIELANEKLQKL